MSKKLLYGVGTNDSWYTLSKREKLTEILPCGQSKSRVIWKCPYYTKWESMLRRCYSKYAHQSHPTYVGCTVCKEWLTFSNFREWMVYQDWEGMTLDKDFLGQNCMVYSPETCVFILNRVNCFLEDRGLDRGNYLLGCDVSRDNNGRFRARCSDPLSRKDSSYLGYYGTELAAHLVWKRQKHEYACELADSEYVTDDRVREVLINRYKNYTILEDHLK